MSPHDADRDGGATDCSRRLHASNFVTSSSGVEHPLAIVM